MAVSNHSGDSSYASDRARQLRDKGFAWFQIVDVLALDHEAGPLRLCRLAHGRSAASVVGDLNQMDPAPNAALRGQRLYDYEMWPESGRRPPVRILRALARIYQVAARRLVTDRMYAGYPAADQADIDGADFSHLDSQHPRHRLVPPQSADRPAGAFSPLDPAPDEGGSSPPGVLTRLTDPDHGESVELFRTVTRMEPDPARQEVLFQLALVLGGVAGLPLVHKLTPEERERLAQVTLSSRRVDSKVVSAFESVTKMSRQVYDSRGPEAVLKSVLRFRKVVAEVLGDVPQAALRERLLRVYGELSQIAGWLLYDLTSFSAADRCFKEGLAASQEGRDLPMTTFIHLCLSQMGCFQKKIPTALDHAFAARGWAARSGSARLASYSETIAAWAFSIDGSMAPTSRALNRAGDLLPDRFTDDDPDFVHFLDRGFTTGVRAGCWLRLGQVRPAMRAAEESVVLTDPAFPRNFGFRLGDLARALVSQKEIEEGAKVIGQVADIAVAQGSMRLAEWVEDVRRSMQPWAGTPGVRHLDERLIALGLAS